MTRHATAFGCYEIDNIPGQPQAAHCHGFVVWPNHRGQGLAHKLKEHQNGMLALQGYDFAACTVATHNQAQKRVPVAPPTWRLRSSACGPWPTKCKPLATCSGSITDCWPKSSR